MLRPEGMDDLEYAELRRQVEEAAEKMTQNPGAGNPRSVVALDEKRQGQHANHIKLTIIVSSSVFGTLFLVSLFLAVWTHKYAPKPLPASQSTQPTKSQEAPMLGALPRLGDTPENTLGVMGKPKTEYIGKEFYMPYDVVWEWENAECRVWVTVFRGKVVEVTVKPPVEFWRFNQNDNPARHLNYIARESMWIDSPEKIYGCHKIGRDGDRLGEVNEGYIFTTTLEWKRFEEKN